VDIFKLLDEMEEHVENSRRVPMTGMVLLNEDVLLDFVDRLRSLLPEELHQAKLLIKDRERLTQDARDAAEHVLAEANQRIEGMVRESEVVRKAQEAAEEIVAQSRRVANEIKNNATQYADDIMSNLESSLEQNLSVIRRGRDELGQLKKAGG
jgi:cell division septum initiation protein DivIVA